MNKQEIEKAICVMENLKYLLIDVLENKNNEREFDIVIEMLEKQLTNGWIPVSERLPEVFNENTSETVLITDGNWIAMGFINNNQQWLFAECSNKGIDIDWTDITAWQPLPEPYKEKE